MTLRVLTLCDNYVSWNVTHVYINVMYEGLWEVQVLMLAVEVSCSHGVHLSCIRWNLVMVMVEVFLFSLYPIHDRILPN